MRPDVIASLRAEHESGSGLKRHEITALFTELESLRASLTRVEEERDALRVAATAVLNTLGEAMPSIDACVTIASLHGTAYRGPALQPSVFALQDCLSRARGDEG